jgi:thiamine biosynthesis lipoprotein
MNDKKIVGALVALVMAYLGISAVAADPPLERFVYVEGHMGTRFKIILYATNKKAADDAVNSAFGRIAALDRMMSDYRDDSELMKLCAKAGGDPVEVSDELFDVLMRAHNLSKRCDGAFDVTVGPLTRLWRQSRKSGKLPDKETLDKARDLVGYDKMTLDDKKHTVRLTKAGMQLDLGGIAKGYAADAALKALKDKGCSRALVAAGGDIAVNDAPPDAEGWKIGIAPLEDPESTPKKYLILHNAGVSTSGDAEQFVEIEGKRYSHIVDPKTGLGLIGRMSVTVVAPNGTTSDSMTKIVAVLGPEKGMKIIDDTEGVSAFMLHKTDKGDETFYSKRFKSLPQKDDDKD